MKLVDNDDELHDLITTWIAATEKARIGWPFSQPAEVVFHSYHVHFRFGEPPVYYLKDHLEMPWDYTMSDDICDYKLECITLEKAARDEIVFFVGGVDSRMVAWFGPRADGRDLVGQL